MTRRQTLCLVALALLTFSGCSKRPDVDGLKESFGNQLAANRDVQNFQRDGGDFTFSFSGPSGDSKSATWRVHIDSATIEPNDDPAQPFRGVVKSSWSVNGHLVQPRGRDSNLPIELTSNGLAQECWAFWDNAPKRWSWE